ncbi:MAG: hypothetical protein PHT79_05345 [Syntrophomonadaceae bacterium]|nr:hypothetical protein [Syntrophomonadaceae bacterium]MDD3888610.1 hypothetical protein [Syntrophomonadaceae bacterium]MDD4549169.1 hypothetical protein [Syntrophomonadaceae bacterium]
MQLPPGEKSILAYFSSATNAATAVLALEERGITETQIDQISRFPGNRTYGGSTNSISAMVIGDGGYDHKFGPLLAADPASSGLGAGYELPGGSTYLVTVVTSNSLAEEAAQVLKEHGAMF